MYYEEKTIDRVLCCRFTPNGEWVKLTPEELTSKIESLKKERADSYEEGILKGIEMSNEKIKKLLEDERAK